MIYNTVILGAGAIAGGYDAPASSEVLTHAHAYLQNPCINLLGFFDIQLGAAQKMAQKWKVNAFETIHELHNTDIDIISICTPDTCHHMSVNDAVALNPKLIFLEKPAGTTEAELTSILKISQETPIQVNYSRRFIPEFQELARRIRAGELGKFLTGHGFYGKGYLHNGSHLRDILEFFLGEIIFIKKLAKCSDFYADDPTQDAYLTFKQGSFYMQGVDCRVATVFELDLIFEKYRIRIVNSGMQIEEYAVQDHSVYSGYSIFSLSAAYSTQANFALKVAVQNMVDFLDGKTALFSPMRYFR